MPLSVALSSSSCPSSAGLDVESQVSNYFESLAFGPSPSTQPAESNLLVMSQEEYNSFVQKLFAKKRESHKNKREGLFGLFLPNDIVIC